jgi:uncharacterized integral membrane protein
MHALPMLLSILVGGMFGVLAWRLLRFRTRETGGGSFWAHDDLLLGLSFLAAFVLGVFLTYVVVSIG